MTDQYTKAMLTIIAAALVVGQNMIAPVGAQSGAQRVVLCDSDDTRTCARVYENRSSGDHFLAVSIGIK